MRDARSMFLTFDVEFREEKIAFWYKFKSDSSFNPLCSLKAELLISSKLEFT